MSRVVHFLRHAESEANAGLPSADPARIPLTRAGRRAATGAAAAWDEPEPDLIVVSPYFRAQETARPFRDRFPGVPTEVWPVEEFTYLDPTKYSGTTPEQRRPAALGYWQSAGPEDSAPGAESFREFLERARSTLSLLDGSELDRILVVSHEQFIQAIRWLVERSPAPAETDLVQRFHTYRQEHPLANLDRWDLDLDDPRLAGSLAVAATAPERDSLSPEETRRGLELLIRDSMSYRTSDRVRELFQFLGRNSWHAPYNAMLLHVQKPDARLVLSATEWAKLGRAPKPDARPLVILYTMGPVAFVFDESDTEGDPLPPVPAEGNLFGDAFQADGTVPGRVWKRLLKNCERVGIDVEQKSAKLWQAGHIRRTRTGRFRIALNADLSPVARFITLAHELAHLFCGHLGPVPGICPARFHLSTGSSEIEAEAAAYAVAMRMGIRSHSERYLRAFLFGGTRPTFSLDTVLVAAGKIEALCAGTFRLRLPGEKRKPNAAVIPPQS